MYKIISKEFEHKLIGNLNTIKEAEKEIKYITEKCDLYEENELEIIKE